MYTFQTLITAALLVATLQGVPYNNWSPKNTADTATVNEQLLFSKVCQSGIREDNTNYIYCARKSLTHVPIFSKNNVVYDELVLADNRITELHANSFSRIKVKKIFLNGNPLRYIDKMTFRKLENHLEELWIDGDTTISSNNLLAKPLYTTNGGLPKAIVDYLRNLNTLRIKGFMVHALRNEILSKLKRIEVLSLTFCSIEKIEPFAFKGLENSLKELYLDGNLMQQVPTQALLNTKFKHLKILSLSQNFIKTISHDSFGSFYMPGRDLSSLNKLDLSYNGLKSIDPEAFINLNRTLQSLKIQNNEINSFNLGFVKNLASLIELNLAFNVITNLPANIFKHSNNLEVLKLQGNSIKFTQSTKVQLSNFMRQTTTPSAPQLSNPSIFQGLNNLKRLNLARNGIQYLPTNIFQPLHSLEALSLDKNPVENFNKQTFNGLHSTLKNLSLQNTDMQSNSLDSLEKFSSLERVKLSFNSIDKLDLKLFTNTHLSLTNLDIRSNSIKYVHFSGTSLERRLENLVEFELSNNKLCGFNEDLLSIMPKLKNLGLTQNPLYCDCKLLPLYEWSQKNFDKDIITFIQWQCELPETNSYRQFTSLSPEEFKCTGISKCKLPQQSLVTSTQPTTTTTAKAEAIKNIGNDRLSDIAVKITNVELTQSAGSILVKWSLSSDLFLTKPSISGFTLSFNEPDKKLKSFAVDASQRTFKIQNLKANTKYSVCVTIDEYKGYDKYCRDLTTDSFKFKSSTIRSEHLSSTASAEQSSSTILKNAGLISGLVITVLSILVVFILGLLFFIYFYIKKCRSNKKLRAKSLMLSSSSSNSATMNSRRHGGYQAPKLTTLETQNKILNVHKGSCAQTNSNSSSPQSTSTISNPNFCSCLQITSQNQQCSTMGRQFLVGDTSTVSSTLSNENLNTMASKANPNYNMQLIPQDNEFCGDMFNRELVRSVPQQPGDLAASSPTSFQHFTLQNQQHGQHYLPYDVFNQNFNPQLMQQLANNNSTLQYDKLSKLNKMIIANNSMSQNSDHVYCEIPSSLGQTLNRANNNNRNVLTFNGNSQVYNYNPQQNLNSLHHHIVNQSLLMSAPGANQSTFQSNFSNSNGNGSNVNSKFSPSVI